MGALTSTVHVQRFADCTQRDIEAAEAAGAAAPASTESRRCWINFKWLIFSSKGGSKQTELDKLSEVIDSGEARRGLTLGLQVI
jgi:hypothetical protein